MLDIINLIDAFLCRYLLEEAMSEVTMSLEEVSKSVWSMEVKEDWPRQQNGSDCGVFMLIGCVCVMFDFPMLMAQDQARFYREKIGISLIRNELIF